MDDAAPPDEDPQCTDLRTRFFSAFAAAADSSPTLASLSREFSLLWDQYGSARREVSDLRAALSAARATPVQTIGAAASADENVRAISALRARLIEAQDDILKQRDVERAAFAERLRLAEHNARLVEDAARLRAASARADVERGSLQAASSLARAGEARALDEARMLRAALASARAERDALATARDDLSASLANVSTARMNASADVVAELNANADERIRAARAREALERRVADEVSRADAAIARAVKAEGELDAARAAVRAATAAREQADAERARALTAMALARDEAEYVVRAAAVGTAAYAEAGAGVAATSQGATTAASSQVLSNAKNVFGAAFGFVSKVVSGMSAESAIAAGGVAAEGGGVNTSLNSFVGAVTIADFTPVSHAELPVPSRARGVISLRDLPIICVSILDAAGSRTAAAEGDRISILDTSACARSPLALLTPAARDVDVTTFCLGMGGTLFSGLSDRSLLQWDISTRTCTRSFAGVHAGAISAMAYTPAEITPGPVGSMLAGTLATAGALDTAVKLWDVRDKGARPARTLAAKSHVNALTVRADAFAVIVGCQDGCVRVFDIRGSDVDAVAQWPPAPAAASRGVAAVVYAAISGLALGPSGAVLVSTRDSGGGSALVLLEEGDFVRRGVSTKESMVAPQSFRHADFALPSRFARGIFSACGHHVLAGGDAGGVCSWSVDRGAFEFTIGGPSVQRAARSAAAAAAAARRRTASTDTVLSSGAFAELDRDESAEAEKSAAAAARAPIHCVAVSSDGSALVTGSAKGRVSVWEV